jgi:hypothetical protein
MRSLLLLLLALAVLAAGAQSASAKTPIRVGIGDQQAAMFDQDAFQRAKIERVRYFIPWNATDNPTELLRATSYVQRARAEGMQVFLHISSDDLRRRRAELPSVEQYRIRVGRLVRHFRELGVREFGTWNEANHDSQPTYRSPTRAASFFRELYRMVKPGCSGCGVVALDVLDQVGVERYMRSFYGALSDTYRRRATIVGIHNYGDVNRKRTTFTGSIIRQARAYNRSTKFWYTETGGIVNFGKNFKCSTSRAASRLEDMFDLARRYRRSGVQRLYVYNWTGAGCDARFDAGLTTPSGRTRAGYTVLRRHLPSFLR